MTFKFDTLKGRLEFDSTRFTTLYEYKRDNTVLDVRPTLNIVPSDVTITKYSLNGSDKSIIARLGDGVLKTTYTPSWSSDMINLLPHGNEWGTCNIENHTIKRTVESYAELLDVYRYMANHFDMMHNIVVTLDDDSHLLAKAVISQPRYRFEVTTSTRDNLLLPFVDSTQI